ncbi:MAG: class I SAM-dependent methyltransferase [Patescibacteria group bacterium]
MLESMSGNPFKKKSLASSVEWAESSNLYKQYVDELKLSPEDLRKRILDVGADFGHFAEVAKRNGYNDVCSIDIKHPADIYDIDTTIDLAGGKMAVADAFQLPFKDEAFDLTISFCAIPNVVKGQNPSDYQKEIKKIFQEMLRVTRVGGEIRLGRVISEHQEDVLKLQRGQQVKEALEWFAKRSRQFETSVEVTDTFNRSPGYLVKIKKLS